MKYCFSHVYWSCRIKSHFCKFHSIIKKIHLLLIAEWIEQGRRQWWESKTREALWPAFEGSPETWRRKFRLGQIWKKAHEDQKYCSNTELIFICTFEDRARDWTKRGKRWRKRTSTEFRQAGRWTGAAPWPEQPSRASRKQCWRDPAGTGTFAGTSEFLPATRSAQCKPKSQCHWWSKSCLFLPCHSSSRTKKYKN